jgi:hypothetical protein
MEKKIVTFVHTEYHLLLFVNNLLNEQKVGVKNKHFLFIRGKEKFRISKDVDLSIFPIEVQFVSQEFSIYKSLNEKSNSFLEEIYSLQPNEFVFYQEMDLLMVVLVNQLKLRFETKIILLQDGLKPYNLLKFNSLSLMKYHHQTNVWMKKNGFSIDSWLSPFWSHRFAFLKEIDEVFLTFPEAYINWNNKSIKKIDFLNLESLKNNLERIFHWDQNLLNEKEKVILYMSQPMHDDGKAEANFIQKLTIKFPLNQVYIKLHPLTAQNKIDEYLKYPNFKLIRSTIPAELFIMQLQSSIILSVNSTSMFLDNRNCKFYYLSEIFKNDIKRLKRYDVKIHPAPHIKLVTSIDEIDF